jgi:uncharacterized damage-inducible protein DinB
MKKNTLFVCAFVALIAVSATAFAQEPANPLSGGEKGFYMMVSGALIAGAEKMPEENYSFKPTPDIRSFGQLVGHAANAQYMFCAIAAGEKSPNTANIEQTMTSKADLVQALKDGVAYCNKVYGGMTDAQASQIVKMFGRDLAKLTVLSVNTAHADEHYGNMVTYLRLKGIVPPTSEPKK